MKAKKHLGQHFLESTPIVDKVLDAIYKHCPSDRPLLEVGPGAGVLTFNLDERYNEFKAVEFDEDMIPHLSELHERGDLIMGNFLSVDLAAVFDNESFSLTGNFPYNISSQIIFKMLDYVDFIPVMVGMFQKELAARICATPGGKQNGVISILAQAYYEAHVLFSIPPEAFRPPPKVHSSVILLKRLEDYGPDCDEKLFKRVVKLGFGQRRKKLRNSLKSLIGDNDDPVFQKRPEELSVKDFVNITNSLKLD